MKIWSRPTGNISTTPGGANNLNDLSDVSISGPQAGQTIIYDGTQFTNGPNNIDAGQIISGTIDYARLPPLNISEGVTPPFISSITTITPSGDQTIEILGAGFLPATNLSIPGATINSLVVRSPNRLSANISKSELSGTTQIIIANGENSNQIWADSIKFININPDLFWENVLLFIKGQGTAGTTNFIDEKNNTLIQSFGNTAISTTQGKYAGSSIYFDGSGDYFHLTNLSLNLTSDFTIEGWIYLINSNPITLLAGNTSGNHEFQIYSSGIWIGRTYQAWDLQLSLNTNLNTWNHIAFCRAGNTLRIFRNGTQVHSTNYTTAINCGPVLIGRDMSGTRQSAGYLSHLRVSNIARYSGPFDPETDTNLNL